MPTMAPQHSFLDPSKLSDSAKDALIVTLRANVEELSASVEELSASVEELSASVVVLRARVEELESAEAKKTVRKDSHNSSVPPSADAFKKTKKTRSLRKKSNKKVGGQEGHIGTTLKQSEHPTEIIVHPLPGQCDRCQMPLPIDGARVSARRQVIELPKILCEIIEHQTLEQVCNCGQVHVSTFPSAVTELVQYGPNVKALGVDLTHGQLLPYGRAAQHIGDLLGFKPSSGTLLAWVIEASGALQGTAKLIAEKLHAAPVLSADESGLRVDSKLFWLHIAATEHLTWYGVHAKRGMEAIIEHGILPKRLGVLVHDCWKPYWALDCIHALCNAHLLRELVYVQELTGQDWPKQMMDFLCHANELCEAARQKNVRFSQADTAALVTVYHAILREGEQLNPEVPKRPEKRGRAKQSVAFNLLDRMRRHADAVLLFIHDHTVPFTNNDGERPVRMAKVKQRISGCFRTFEGAQHFCIIRSCLATLHKQGHKMIDVLRQAFAGTPIVPADC